MVLSVVVQGLVMNRVACKRTGSPRDGSRARTPQLRGRRFYSVGIARQRRYDVPG